MNPQKTTDARDLFIAVCRRAFSMGLQVATGGNLSMRIRAGGFLVKPSGTSLLDLTADDLLVCDDQGRLEAGTGKPSKEFSSHLAVYRVRPLTGAIVHYHPPHATAFAVARRELPLPTVHARRILQKVPLITPPGEGSPELSDALAQVFSNQRTHAALMADHGIICAGADIRQAHNLAELVEESARIAYLASSIAAMNHI